MDGLLVIAPLSESVDIRGAAVPVGGLSAQAIAGLLYRFPEIMKMWGSKKWDAATLLSLSDQVVAAIVASACPRIDEANAMHLSLDEKAELIGAVLRLTMPRGIGPFMETLTRIAGAVSVETAPKRVRVTS